MQLVVLILPILVEVWFGIFRVQLQEEQKVSRGRDADSAPRFPGSSPGQQPSWLPDLPSPHCLKEL